MVASVILSTWQFCPLWRWQLAGREERVFAPGAAGPDVARRDDFAHDDTIDTRARSEIDAKGGRVISLLWDKSVRLIFTANYPRVITGGTRRAAGNTTDTYETVRRVSRSSPLRMH